MLTGSRLGEVLNVKWSHVDRKRAVWTKPSHATKQGQEEHVPLSPEAMVVFERMAKKRKSSPYVFPSATDPQKPRSTVRCVWMQALKKVGLVEPYTKAGKRRKEVTRYHPTIRLHDLRHSYASFLVNRGYSLRIIGELLGHRQPATTMRYTHLDDKALRDATGAVGDIFSPKNGKKESTSRRAHR